MSEDFDVMAAINGVTEVTEDDAKNYDFKNTGKLALSDDMAYLSLDVERFNRFCRPILGNCSSFKDIVSSSVNIQVGEKESKVFGTDSVSFIEVIVPTKANKFLKEITLNLGALFNVVKTQAKDQVLLLKDNKIYADFYGGEIFIQSYTMDSAIYRLVDDMKEFPEVYDAKKLHLAIEAAMPVLAFNQIPELAYVFLTEDGAFSTSGQQVVKYNGKFPACAIRQKDVAVLRTLLSHLTEGSVKILMGKKAIGFVCDIFKYYVPLVNRTLLPVQTEMKKTTGAFNVDTGFFSELIQVMSTMPESVGTADMVFEQGQLKLKFTTRRGDVSNLLVSNAVIGDVKTGSFSVSLKQLMVFGKVFRLDGMVNVGFGEKFISFCAGDKQVNLNLG